MSSRERILERIRKAQGRGGSKPSRAELEAVETYLRAHPRGTPPKVEGDLVARFRAHAGSMQSTTEEVAAKAEVPAAVARYLRSSDLPLAGCVWPQLAGLDLTGAGLALEPRGAHPRGARRVARPVAAHPREGTRNCVPGPATPPPRGTLAGRRA